LFKCHCGTNVTKTPAGTKWYMWYTLYFLLYTNSHSHTWICITTVIIHNIKWEVARWDLQENCGPNDVPPYLIDQRRGQASRRERERRKKILLLFASSLERPCARRQHPAPGLPSVMSGMWAGRDLSALSPYHWLSFYFSYIYKCYITILQDLGPFFKVHSAKQRL
jgi:hypothetical protein